MTALITQPPLRLMIYDSSDTKGNLKTIKKSLSEKTQEFLNLILPDDIEDFDFDVPLGLTHSWIVGGKLYKLFGSIDEAKGFKSWEDALAWLTLVGSDRKISEVQIWGHGSPGRSWMLEDGALDENSPTSTKYGVVMKMLKERLAPDAHIWFRNCSVFAGVKGHFFARAWADFFQCRVSAHTHIIGFWQAGLHTAVPGIEPHWDLKEGEGGRAVSRFGSPNRITCLNNEVPRGW
jgi:hypothetical protein